MKMKGTAASPIEMKPSKLEPHSVPRLWYMYGVTKGRTQAASERMKVLAATAEPATDVSVTIESAKTSATSCYGLKTAVAAGTRCCELTGVQQVVQSRLKDKQEAGANKDEADDRGEPVDVWRARPGEEEEPDGERHAAQSHWWQAILWCERPSCLVETLGEVPDGVDEVDGGTRECADEHGQQRQSPWDGQPASPFFVDNRDRREERIQIGVGE